jgi:hypothetical protein
LFARAYAVAAGFTRPIVISHRTWAGRVEANAATYVILNSDGWFATAAHVFGPHVKFDSDRAEIAAHRAALDALEADPDLSASRRRSQRRLLESGARPDWLTNISYWWGRDGVGFVDVQFDGELDLAIGRLDPFPSDFASSFPTFKNPDVDFDPGTSLCRLGYPFHEIDVSFDAATNAFMIDKKQLAAFPLEGIFTRTISGGTNTAGSIPILMIETSSPGLRGQSGGPVFDARGRVWGIQSRTKHIALGFNPVVEVSGRKVEEHQFINLGWAVHPRVVIDYARARGVHVEVSAD